MSGNGKKLAPIPQDDPGKRHDSKAQEAEANKKELAKKLEAQRRQARTFAKQQQIAERLATATEELSSSVEESTSAVEELRAAVEQIASGAEESSSAAGESLAAINQITKGVELAAKNASTALERGQAIQNVVRATSADIEKIVNSVNAAAQSNAESARLVGELENQAEEIGNIISTVVKIADQTNLLALNAAIEAARAGEHGKGFAVVADEVRTLAEISEKAANDIRELVSNIQRDVNAIAKDINSAADTVRQES